MAAATASDQQASLSSKAAAAADEAQELCDEARECMARVAPLADCTLISADGTNFKTSRTVLALCSKFFGGMFTELSADQQCIQLEESAAEIACLLNYAYAGHKYTVTPDNILPCLKMAHKFDITRLREACEAYLVHLELSVGTVPFWIDIAGAYGLSGLMDCCVKFAAEHLDAISTMWNKRTFPPRNFLESLPSAVRAMITDLRIRVVAGWAVAIESCECHMRHTQKKGLGGGCGCGGCGEMCRKIQAVANRPLSREEITALEEKHG